MKNPVTWFEIIGKDSAGLQRFYREVFDWKLTPPIADMGNYSMLAEHGPNEKGAGGGIGGSSEDQPRVTVYVEVDDPQRYLDRALAKGAELMMPVTTVTPTTTIAIFRDPAGNVTGIMKANPPRPVRTTRKRTIGRRKTTAKRTTARRTTARRKTTRRGRR